MNIEHSISQLVIANGAVLLGSAVQTTTGMGFAMVSVPLLALISLDLVPGPTIFVNLFLTFLMLNDGRSTIVRQEMTILLPAILAGTVLGALVLSMVPSSTLGILFALLVLMAVALTFFVDSRGLSKTGLVVGGMASGLMGTASGIHGPPLAILYQHEHIQKIRATMALVFLVAYSLSLIALAASGKFDFENAMVGLILLPGLLAGFLVGMRVRQHFSQSLGRTIMLCIATASAIVLLVKSIQ